MVNCRSILVATDFSPASDEAVMYGREMAKLLDADLCMIHVVTDLVASGVMPMNYLPDIGAQHEIELAARERLERMAREQHADCKITTVTVASPNAAAAIVEYAREHPIDLVIVGSHGNNGVVHMLLGSVAEKVVRDAPCPVLTVRQAERDFVAADTSTHHAATH